MADGVYRPDYSAFPQIFDAVFFSDSHLFHHKNGAIAKQHRALRHVQAEEIHLAGDIVDWEGVVRLLKKRYGLNPKTIPRDVSTVLNLLEPHIPDLENHMAFVEEIFRKIRDGVKVIYEPGNHDENMDVFNGNKIHGIHVQSESIYVSKSGEAYLVAHGHRFDLGWLQRNKGWYQKGSTILDHALAADIWMGGIVPPLKGHFLFANGIKKIGKSYIKIFEKNGVKHALAKNVDGIICGHIHDQKIKTKSKSGIHYINCGDGLTHGTGIAHAASLSDDPIKQFVRLEPKPLKKSWAQATMPFDFELRLQTLRFLQTGWEACLEYLGQKPEFFDMPDAPDQKPEIALELDAA